MHVPVLLKEVIDLLDPKEGEFIIDGTAGAGGHSREILKKVGESGKVALVDWDKRNIENLKKEFSGANAIFFNANYAELPGLIKDGNLPKADGLLLDLGFSSDQLAGSGRGFSFNPPAGGEPLLMTYGDESETLEEFLRRATFSELADIISRYGEERYARRIAEAIFSKKSAIRNTEDLAAVIRTAVPKSYERGRLHPATRTFQALRIYLNKELDNLKSVLDSLEEIIKPGGRVAIISFHSLEDRIVKSAFNESAKKGRLKILTKKPITASLEEVRNNPRARSAKLRAAALI